MGRFDAPIQITAGPWLPSAGYPSGSQLTPLAYRLDAYEHTVVDQGGEESASVRLTAPLRQAAFWRELAGGVFFAYDQGAQRVFHGTITTVEINDGARSTSFTTDGMANSVRVVYTRGGYERITAASENASSISRFYRRELIHLGGNVTQTEAENQRGALLSALAWPLENTVAGLTSRPSRGEASVALQVRGWWHALGWSAYKANRSGSATNSVSVQTLINAAVLSSAVATWGNNISGLFASTLTWLYTGSSGDSGSSPLSSTVPATRGYEYAGEVAERVLALGTSTGGRLSWGFNLELRPNISGSESYAWVREWAGTAPDTIDYYLHPPYTLWGPGLAPMAWTRARPDTMAQILGVTPQPPRASGIVDADGRFYVSRITYRWERGSGETLQLEPLNDRSAVAVLARGR